MADPHRKRPALAVIRDGNPGKRPINPGVVLPETELTEPDWSETFTDNDDPDNERCREVASAEWRRVVPVLKQSAGLAAVDLTLVHDYCVVKARIDQCERDLSRNGLTMWGERGQQKNGASTIVGQYRQQLARYIGELGLSPSSRTKLAPPESGGSVNGIFD